MYRVFVSTDLDGGPDDIQSLVQLRHYADLLRIAGLISTAARPSAPSAGCTPGAATDGSRWLAQCANAPGAAWLQTRSKPYALRVPAKKFFGSRRKQFKLISPIGLQ